MDKSKHVKLRPTDYVPNTEAVDSIHKEIADGFVDEPSNKTVRLLNLENGYHGQI